MIPTDWDVKTIDQIAFVTSGKRMPLGSSLVDQQTTHPYIRVTDMRPGTVALADIKFVPENVFPAISRYRIYQADIFISVAGSLGVVGKVPAELDGANLTENANRITDITCSQDYLLYVLLSPLIQSTINSIRTVGAQPKLALTRIRKFTIPLPPTDGEQRAIATALSDVDALLGGLDRLIAKKRDLKQAAMQQLLTGQTRLPGFSGEWEVVEFGDIATIRNTKVLALAAPAGIQCVELESIGSGSGRLLMATDASGLSSKYSFKKGDVLFGRLRAYLRKYWLATFDGVCSTEIWPLIARDGRLCGGFLHLVVQTNNFVNAAGVSYGTHMPRSDWSVLKKLPVWLPPVPEQTAIATILSDMDAELSALEARRDKTRDLKQAMMQELLTGRIRLI
ncbi:MAG: restriction endonuclease subunit S [Deltaproteobacteria bacterium]|nr:restriction endonuclease subunit S [Deltaproteobacteria bacterium]